MKTQYLSIQEASLLSHKHSNTIRELLKSNKVQYTKENRKYLILKESLALYYKENSEEILSFWEEKNTTITKNVSNNLLTEQLKPLVESLSFHIKKYDEVQKLLTNSNNEKIELEKQYSKDIQSQKLDFSQERESLKNNHKKLLSKKNIFIKILIVVIWLLLLTMLIQSKILTINF